MISHDYKCIFIHLPKNAGQSIEHVFLKLLNLTWETRAPLLLRSNDQPTLGPPRLAHLKASEYVRFKYLTQEMFDNYYKFSFVRNPWGRLISFYKYLEFNKNYDFKTFLMKHFSKELFIKMGWFVGEQYKFLYSENGELLVDYVGKFESLDNDFEVVCEKINIPITKVPHINSSSNIRNNQTNYLDKKKVGNSKSYQKYYDEESKQFVADLYENDIKLFNYKF